MQTRSARPFGTPQLRTLQPRAFTQECALAAQKILRFLDDDVAAYVRDGVGERNALGADLDAVLREAALLDAAVTAQRAQPFFLEHLPRRVIVEQLHLRDGCRTHKVCILVKLRANL